LSDPLRITQIPEPLRNQVVDRLRGAICEHRFKPGERLVERQLGELLGVSRTLVREALRRLEAEGFVASHPRRGITVAELGLETVRSIYEVRAVLEALAGELFVQRATAADRKRLRQAFATFRAAHEQGEETRVLLAATARFYDAVVAGARNEVVEGTLRTLGSRIHMLRARSMSVPGRRELSFREMEVIFEALMGSDPTLAWQRCRQHVDAAYAYALRSFEEQAPVSEPQVVREAGRR
jgi:GntR family transcriptional regulator, trigonelline degradation regulator